MNNKHESSSDDGGKDSDFNPAMSDDDDEYSKPAPAPVQSPKFVSLFTSILFLSINFCVLRSVRVTVNTAKLTVYINLN